MLLDTNKTIFPFIFQSFKAQTSDKYKRKDNKNNSKDLNILYYFILLICYRRGIIFNS